MTHSFPTRRASDRGVPSNEAGLIEARAGGFAGCISASANINARVCAKAFRAGDERALGAATALRALVSRKALIPSIKAMIAWQQNDPAFETLLPPQIGRASCRERVCQYV